MNNYDEFMKKQLVSKKTHLELAAEWTSNLFYVTLGWAACLLFMEDMDVDCDDCSAAEEYYANQVPRNLQ